MRTFSCKHGDISSSSGAEADMFFDFTPLLEGIILPYLVGIFEDAVVLCTSLLRFKLCLRKNQGEVPFALIQMPLFEVHEQAGYFVNLWITYDSLTWYGFFLVPSRW